MDLLKLLLLLPFILSCAKTSYIVQQGVGQLSLQWGSRPNSIYLEDEKTDPEIKRKIQLVEAARAYFSEYWNHPPGRLYTRTRLLDREAVTYLVIASPKDRIEAHQECFWVMGCFPYLGFFDFQAAQSYQKKLERRGLVTYLRPVYAYSTLGYFDDPILSSFFLFDDRELTELVFHELYHTYFFVKNEVNLNENLANYVAREMLADYYQLGPEERSREERALERERKLRQALLEQIEALNTLYQTTQEPPEKALETYLEEKFIPHFQQLCSELSLSQENCFPLKQNWNNAVFSAYSTYETRAHDLQKLHDRLGGVRPVQLYIEEKYQQYDSLGGDAPASFEDFLFQK